MKTIITLSYNYADLISGLLPEKIEEGSTLQQIRAKFRSTPLIKSQKVSLCSLIQYQVSL